MPFTTSTPATLLEAIALIERDFPACGYSIGKCPCGDPAGNYRAWIAYEGKRLPGVTVLMLDLASGTVEHAHPTDGSGWEVDCHGPTLLDATLRAYGKALEKEGGQ